MELSQVDTAISKASRLMNEDYMNYLDNVSASKFGGKARGKRKNSGVNDLALLEQQAFGYSQNSGGNYAKQNFQTQANQQPRQFSSSVLQESFAKQPPMSDYNFPGAASMGVAGAYQPGASLMTEQQQFVQQPQQVYQPQYQPQQGGGINYEMIKYLVSEAIKENLAEIKQSLLNEGTLRGINMPGGNKIQFLDTKGNLYEGQLVLKKKK